MAAVAAVATGKQKRKRPHVFESNPSIRERQNACLGEGFLTHTVAVPQILWWYG